jgi:hypothetical protein
LVETFGHASAMHLWDPSTNAVASVTGNVGGNVTGSVGSVATGGITAASLATDAITAAKLAADAVTEIQSGLATATALTTATTHLTDIKGTGWTADSSLVSIAAAGELHGGTAQAGAATTITLAADAPAYDLADGVVAIVQGTGKGQSRRITAYDTGTKVATVGTWKVTPDATSEYLLYDPDPAATGGGGGDATEANQTAILAAIATVDAVADAIKVKTDFLPSVAAGAALGLPLLDASGELVAALEAGSEVALSTAARDALVADMLAGTITAATSATIFEVTWDDARTPGADVLAGAGLLVTSGTLRDDRARIASNTATSGGVSEVTLASGLTGTPATGVTVSIKGGA